MDYEPDFCTPGNFSNNPSTRVGTTERFRNTADDTRGSGYYGNPWWASDQPYHRHHGWEDNTRFYELQAGRVGMGPPTANLRAEEQARLAQLDIPRSYLDFYPAAAYMGLDGYGPYSDMPADQNPVRDTPPEPENDSLREHFSNGQEPWYVSAQPWYATNYADDVAYGTYESKRYQPIYRAAAEARTQELGALYNNGDLKSPGIETFATAAEYGAQALVVPAWCTGACAARYRRAQAQGKPEHLVAAGTADIYWNAGSDVDEPTPYRGNVPPGVFYPRWADFTMFGCTSTDCDVIPHPPGRRDGNENVAWKSGFYPPDDDEL